MLIKLLSLMFAFLLLVSFHELGHFLAAKWARVKVLKFALGFPPWLFSIKLGETVYSMGMTLMGGFVRMQGEEMVVGENEVLDERDYRKKPIWKRAIIILAGPVFSLFLALPITIYCLSMGILQPPPVVGAQPRESSFYAAGLRPGDRIVEMDGTPIYHRQSLVMHTLLNCDHPMVVKYKTPERDEAGNILLEKDGREKLVERTTTVQPFPMSMDLQDTAKIYGAGLEAPQWNMGVKLKNPGFQFRNALMITQIGEPAKKNSPAMPAAAAGLVVGDEIVALNGQPIEDFLQLLHYVIQNREKPLTISVIHRDKPDTRVDLKLTPVNVNAENPKLPADYKLGLGANPVYVVTDVTAGSAANKAGVKPGMLMRSSEKTKVTWALSANPFNPQDLTYWDIPGRSHEDDSIRDITLEFAAIPPGVSLLEVLKRWDDTGVTAIAKIEMAQEADTASLRNQIVSQPILTPEIQTLPAEYLHGASSAYLEIPGNHEEYQQFRGVGNLLTVSWNYYLSQIFDMLLSLKKIFGDIMGAGRGVAGPLGIGKMLWSQGDFHGDQAMLQFNRYMMFIAFISINLGIMNLLPIPILDGGHLLMLTIEAIRRKPLTRVFAERFQMIGLFILLGLFLFATSMDLIHLFT